MELYGDRVCRSLEDQTQLMQTAKTPAEFKAISAKLDAKANAHMDLVEEMEKDSWTRKSDFEGELLDVLCKRMDKLLDDYNAEQDRLIIMTAFGRSDLEQATLKPLHNFHRNPFSRIHKPMYYFDVRNQRIDELRKQYTPPPQIDNPFP